MQRFALALIAGLTGLWGEHQPQRVNDVRTRFLSSSALAKDAGDLGNRRDRPAVLAGS